MMSAATQSRSLCPQVRLGEGFSLPAATPLSLCFSNFSSIVALKKLERLDTKMPFCFTEFGYGTLTFPIDILKGPVECQLGNDNDCYVKLFYSTCYFS